LASDPEKDTSQDRDKQVAQVLAEALAIGVALVVTPAVYHRQVAPYAIPDNFIKVTSGFMTAASIPLMLAISIDVYLVSKLALDSPPVCVLLATTLLLVFIALWIVFPRVMCARRRRAFAAKQAGELQGPR
jgi:cytochrome bd-type quinol oxidase subunit 2